mgnify:CR=1 FL=1
MCISNRHFPIFNCLRGLEGGGIMITSKEVEYDGVQYEVTCDEDGVIHIGLTEESKDANLIDIMTIQTYGGICLKVEEL